MPDKTRGAGLKVLVIDDEPGVCNTLTVLLGEEGFEVLGASSGEDGIGIARENNPDIILLDIEMPGMTGPKVCRILKEDPAFHVGDPGRGIDTLRSGFRLGREQEGNQGQQGETWNEESSKIHVILL